MSWSNLTDKGNVDFAKVEYKDLLVGSSVRADGKNVGFIYSITNNDEGGTTFVVTPNRVDPNATNLDEVTNVAVLFQGSSQPFSEEEDWKKDWVDNDISMAWKLMTGGSEVPPQLKASSDSLNAILKKFPNASIDLYGHSLGSSEGQFALATVSDPNRIRNAFLYQGPNIYSLLDSKQRNQVDNMKGKIFNFVDEGDIVAMKYKNLFETEQPAVGSVFFIHPNPDPKGANVVEAISNRHMWGGYQYTSNQAIQFEKGKYNEETIRQSKLASEFGQLDFLARSSNFTSESERIFLDNAEATLIIDLLKTKLDDKMTKLDKQYEQCTQLIEEYWTSTLELARTAGPHLSEGEVISALAAGGATELVLRQNPIIELEVKRGQVQQIKEKFDHLFNEINKFIKDSVANDEEESTLFNNWHEVDKDYTDEKSYANQTFGKPFTMPLEPNMMNQSSAFEQVSPSAAIN